MASDVPQDPTKRNADADVSSAAEAFSVDAAGTHDSATAALARAVDDLAGVTDLPVHEHAGRYQAMHTVLQDALSATDRSAD